MSRRDYYIEQSDRIHAEAKAETGIAYQMARRRYCKHGHDLYNPENYKFSSDGRRLCLVCRRSL